MADRGVFSEVKHAGIQANSGAPQATTNAAYITINNRSHHTTAQKHPIDSTGQVLFLSAITDYPLFGEMKEDYLDQVILLNIN
ncbi:hypothetical protein [Ruminococcus sp. NK3A76]|uniref:hypothetical protein n=1 Tax=Ruminococcus sp. NK3A76 TaxID=877411 RepID=UPI0012EB8D41|nr:hypothetical protein [Ruminococcus sp. NK3A76]